jgi:hypothetical protein
VLALSYSRECRFWLRGAVCALVAAAAFCAVPALAHADFVTVRIEAKSGTLVARTAVTLPPTAVAPGGKDAQGTCAGNSVIGALQAATGGDWDGTWSSDGTGWSIDAIKGIAARPGDTQPRKWLVLVDGVLVNTVPPVLSTPASSPCTTILQNQDTVTIYPGCIGATTSGCFTTGPLDITAPATAGPGANINVLVYETNLVGALDANGNGMVQRKPSLSATVIGPNGSALTDSIYGTGVGVIFLSDRGQNVVAAAKGGHVPDHVSTCVTDGADGFCGTAVPTPVPFDPYAFCKTTGNDGYCNSPDQIPPVGHIGTPFQAQTYSGGGPTKFSGTVDFDPSQTDFVNLRLMRQRTVKVTKYKVRKVWTTKRVHGKKVRKRVKKRVAYKVKKIVCSSWSDANSAFKTLKKCDASNAAKFKAAGAEAWTYDFTSALPSGSYTLDALAVDGAGNVDPVELGRNRVTFKVG